jgi:C1A family cysteine protease
MKKTIFLVFLISLFLSIFLSSKDFIKNNPQLFTASLSSGLSISINRSFSSSSSAYKFQQPKPIYSLSISGVRNILKTNGYARLILIDSNNKKYLIYESAGPYDSGSLSFANACEETCSLNGITPKELIVEISGATITINSISASEDLNSAKSAKTERLSYQSKLLKIQNYIKNNNLGWTAGETSMSKLSYENKRKVFGVTIGKDLPNTQGFEFYKGCIFSATNDTTPKTSAQSLLPKTFDWRNRHGKNWITSIKNQHPDFDIFGCGSCWAFAGAGTVEAIANIYFNKTLNLDLSEQDLISCYNGSGCDGLPTWHTEDSLKYIEQAGIIPETCFRYTATNNSCSNRCNNFNSLLVKSGSPVKVSPDEESIKKALITKGPLVVDMTSAIPSHAMILVGYDTTPDFRTIWIYKNSWGEDWGEKGYLRSTSLAFIFQDPSLFYINTPIRITGQNPGINCVDEDADSYCNWGISETKPITCPSSCGPKKDCDDSNKNLGPFDSNFNCTIIGTTDTKAPSVGKLFPSPNIDKYYKGGEYTLKVKISDDKGVSGCQLLINGSPDLGSSGMTLDTAYCKDCYATATYWAGINEGNMQLSARCWDENGNIQTGEPLTVTINNTAIPIVETITPTSAIIDKETTFSAQVFADAGISFCHLNIDNNVVGQTTLSKSDCKNCIASTKYTFSSSGSFSVFVNCVDRVRNKASGKPVKISVADASQVSIGPIQTENLGLKKNTRFYTTISSDIPLSTCVLKINGIAIDYMQLSQSPCKNCTATLLYTINSPGTYSAIVKCVSQNGNGLLDYFESKPTVINLKCPICDGALNTCQSPTVCSKACGADQLCDGKKPYESWRTTNVCSACNGGCKYKAYAIVPIANNFKASGNNCFYNCTPTCDSNGWWISSYSSTTCNTDSKKLCPLATCNNIGWDNSKCGGSEVMRWRPCDSTCDATSSCGFISKDGTAKCEQNETVIGGKCSPLSNSKVTQTYKSGNGWYCKFACKTLLCLKTVGGCAYAQCKGSF